MSFLPSNRQCQNIEKNTKRWLLSSFTTEPLYAGCATLVPRKKAGKTITESTSTSKARLYAADMFLEADDALFRRVLYKKAHVCDVFHSFLPDRPQVVYSLRARSHNKSLICKTSHLNERNFLVRVIIFINDCYYSFYLPVILLSLSRLYTCCVCQLFIKETWWWWWWWWW